MQHYMYVSVSELLNNSGILNTGASLYRKSADGTFTCIGWFEQEVQVTEPYNVTVSQEGRTFWYDTEMAFVKVLCTPTYTAL